MAVSNTLAPAENPKKQLKFSQAIELPEFQTLIGSAIRDDKSRNRFVTTVMAAVSANADLQKCDAGSVLSSALQGEALGLSLQSGDYAIIPYGNKWNAQTQSFESYQARFRLMTGGRYQLAMRSMAYKNIDSIPIKEGEFKGLDAFSGQAKIRFIEDDVKRDELPVVGYYAFFTLLNGFTASVYFSKNKVLAHAERYSPSFDMKLYNRMVNGETLECKEKKKTESPWYQTFDKMACNYALRELLKKGPRSIEMQDADAFEMQEEKTENTIKSDNNDDFDFFSGNSAPDDTPETGSETKKTTRGKKTATAQNEE